MEAQRKPQEAQRKTQSLGGKELAAYRAGRRLGQRQAIYAKCFDCRGGYVDGRLDCLVDVCSLYPYMPYRRNRIPDILVRLKAQRARAKDAAK